MFRSSLFALLLAMIVAAQPAIAAVSVVQTATSNPGTSGRSPSVTFGGAPANGDLLLILVAWASSTVIGTLPAGYTSIQKNQSLTGCYAQFSFYEVASSAAATITFTNLLSSNAVYSITGLDLAGQNTTTPINASANNGTNACGATHSVVPATTSTTTGPLVVTFGVDDGTGTAISAPSGYSPIQAITAFNTTGHVGVYDSLFTSGGSGSLNANYGSPTDAHAQIMVVAPQVTPTPAPATGSVLMMGCCR